MTVFNKPIQKRPASAERNAQAGFITSVRAALTKTEPAALAPYLQTCPGPVPEAQAGFTLFIALVTVSIVLAIGISILNISLKEFILSSVTRDSEVAFYAADAGMECALYWDQAAGTDSFNPNTSSSITCMGVSNTVGGAGLGNVTSFQVSWGTPALCAIVQVTKYDSAHPVSGVPACAAGVTCTKVESRGYSRGCATIATDPRTVERALRTRY